MSDTYGDVAPRVTVAGVVLESGKNKQKIDLTLVMTDVDIFEHLDKPYLTGVMGVSDTQGVLNAARVGSGDKVTIAIKSLFENKTSIVIKKEFYVSRIISTDKPNDTTDYYILHLVEDISYLSSLKNINKSYTGTPLAIISSIAEDGDFGKKVAGTGDGHQKAKVIIPNMTPLDAMSWIKNRATTVDGYPFYLYSTLVEDDLRFSDLESLLKEPTMTDVPFTHIESNMSGLAASGIGRRRTITQFDHSDECDVLSMVRDGLIAGTYNYLDTMYKRPNKFEFNVVKDVIDGDAPLSTVIPKKSDVEVKYDQELNFHTNSTRTITQIGGTLAYDSKTPSYGESTKTGDYKLNVISRTIHSMLKSTPLNITVDGTDFMLGEHNSTIGRKIPIRFLKNEPEIDKEDAFDKVKSGDYLIFATKHSFRKENYNLSLTCMKLFDGGV